MITPGKTVYYTSDTPMLMNFVLSEAIGSRSKLVLDRPARTKAMADPDKAREWLKTVYGLNTSDGRVVWLKDVGVDEGYWIEFAASRRLHGLTVSGRVAVVVSFCSSSRGSVGCTPVQILHGDRLAAVIVYCAMRNDDDKIPPLVFYVAALLKSVPPDEFDVRVMCAYSSPDEVVRQSIVKSGFYSGPLEILPEDPEGLNDHDLAVYECAKHLVAFRAEEALQQAFEP